MNLAKDIVAGVCLALPLLLFGMWGLRNAEKLAPTHFKPERREKKIRDMRRGSYLLIGMATLVLVVLAVGSVVRGVG